MTAVPDSKVVAVFGAGPGLGAAIGRRFGREGYRIALVARRPESVNSLVTQLTNAGIDAAGFTTDLAHTEEIPAVTDAINARFGRIDIVEYAPIAAAPFIAAERVTPAALAGYVRLLYGPVAVANATLPGMLKRGDGAFLLTQGGSAAHPAPGRSGVGPVMAAARNWAHSLHGELADAGVYVGLLTISALITGSAGAEGIATAPSTFSTVEPDLLADLYWDMTRTRDRIETFWPPAA